MSLHLIIAATKVELEPLLARLQGAERLHLPYGEALRGCANGVPLVATAFGVGKVNTAAGLALAVGAVEASTVIQVGIGGAFAGSHLEPGSAAVAGQEVHLDCGVTSRAGFLDMEELGFPLLTRPQTTYNRIPVDRDLSRELAADRWPMFPFGTAETVTGVPGEEAELARRFGVAIESMEGAAAAQVCLALGVPFAEVRGVSNFVGERDKGRWRIAAAIAAAHEVLDYWLRRGTPTGGK
ncbi:MAG: futalosine hydrolase [Trueperaceae bacterium]